MGYVPAAYLLLCAAYAVPIGIMLRGTSRYWLAWTVALAPCGPLGLFVVAMLVKRRPADVEGEPGDSVWDGSET